MSASVRRLRVILAGVLLIVALVPMLASAHHIAVDRSDPAPGSVVTAPPREVRVRFDMPVQMPGSGLQVTDGQGVRRDQSTRRADDDANLLIAALGPVGAGTYTVIWRAAGANDLESYAQGSFQFLVAAAEPEPRGAGGPAVLLALLLVGFVTARAAMVQRPV